MCFADGPIKTTLFRELFIVNLFGIPWTLQDPATYDALSCHPYATPFQGALSKHEDKGLERASFVVHEEFAEDVKVQSVQPKKQHV